MPAATVGRTAHSLEGDMMAVPRRIINFPQAWRDTGSGGSLCWPLHWPAGAVDGGHTRMLPSVETEQIELHESQAL